MQNVKNVGEVPYGNGVIFVLPGDSVSVDEATAAYLLSDASPVPFAAADASPVPAPVAPEPAAAPEAAPAAPADAPEPAAPAAQEPPKVVTKPTGKK